MIELSNQLNFLLIVNSIGIVILILNQNDNSRDYIQKSISAINPLEKFTWFSLILQLGIFLIKIKNSDF